MATIRKHREKWQAQIRLRGIKPISKSFDKKSDAIRWARCIEGEISVGTYADPRAAERTCLTNIIDRHIDQLDRQGIRDPARRSRLRRLRSDLGEFSLDKLTTQQLIAFRDRRLQEVSSTTVAHELSLVRRLLNLANTEMGVILPKGLPLFPMPRLPGGRTRRLVADEKERLLTVCTDDPQLQDLIQLAIETCMRRSELINIRPDDVNWKNATLLIPKTKNGEPRVIPLTPRAKSILERYMGDKGTFSDLTATRASQKFAAACKRAGINDLRLHDLRHEGVSRLVERGLSTMQVAAISGHKNLSMLMRYSHPDPALLAKKLAA